MVRRASGAPVVNTAVIIALLNVRGGRAFTACYARGCSNARGACTAAAAAFAPSFNNSNVNNSLLLHHHHHHHRRHHHHRHVDNSIISAAFSTHLCPPVAASTRRRTRHVVPSSLSSTPMSHPSFSTLPSKRHRNTFLSPPPRPPPPPPPPRASPEHATAPAGWGHGPDPSAVVSGGAEGVEEPLALVLLNTKGDYEAKHLLRRIWEGAALRVCADGAANRLHDSFNGELPGERERFIPDVIVGDLDSLRPEVSAFYSALGTDVKLVEDQDHNDFEKCLVEVEARLSIAATRAPAGATLAAAAATTTTTGAAAAAAAVAVATATTASTATGTASTTTATAAVAAAAAAAAAAAGSSDPRPVCPATVVGLGAFGGRFDHEMAGISVLHAYTSRFSRLVLMGSENVAFLLQPGLSHVIEADPRFEGPTVGLIPVGGACRSVSTEGLKWNLEGGCLEFGVLVSSSNCVVAEEVRVTTDAPLVWTAEFRAAEWIESLNL